MEQFAPVKRSKDGQPVLYCTLSVSADGWISANLLAPLAINPVSRDQICVRGRFHYDALKRRDRLSRPLLRRGDVMAPVTWGAALDEAAGRLNGIIERHGADAVGFLGSPLLSNEEAYTLQKLARLAVGSNNLAPTQGVAHRIVQLYGQIGDHSSCRMGNAPSHSDPLLRAERKRCLTDCG